MGCGVNKMAKILVAEDDETMLMVIKTLLKKEGHEVICSTTGLHALNFIKDNPDIDLLISDIIMPELDGRKLVEDLLSQREIYKFPIIVMSGFIPFKDIRHIMDMGVSRFIPKPFQNSEFLSEVKDCLESGEQAKTKGGKTPHNAEK